MKRYGNRLELGTLTILSSVILSTTLSYVVYP
jgi:hypothetical protein